MNVERLPQKNLVWCPPGKRKKGRPRNPWVQEITTGIRGTGINDMKWINREHWRRKQNFGHRKM